MVKSSGHAAADDLEADLRETQPAARRMAELAVLLAQPRSELVAHALRSDVMTDELRIQRGT